MLRLRLAAASALVLVPLFAFAQPPAAIGDLRFIGAVTVPNDAKVDGDLVGGLSGLAYDAKSGLYAMLSDDKSDWAPARFYLGKLDFDAKAFTSAELQHSVHLLQSDGTTYPNGRAGGEVPDPEAIALDPQTGNYWWTSEGDRRRGLSPFERISDAEGHFVAALPTPERFAVHKDQELGSRHNLTFEGLAFAPDGKSAWVAMETALYEDGPIATVEAGTVARLRHIDRDGKELAEYAYPVDPIQAKPAGKNADNGVSDILALDDHRLLVMERSGVEGAEGIWTMFIRLYEVDVAGSTDIKDTAALAGASYRPVAKQLVLDLSKHPEFGRVDNLEGMTFGPPIADGNRSLVLVSDNNFNPASQVTQFLAFEVLPPAN